MERRNLAIHAELWSEYLNVRTDYWEILDVNEMIKIWILKERD
jgi:hypothetical protein